MKIEWLKSMDRYRCRDLILTMPLLILAGPLMCTTAVFVRACMGPPVLFRQARIGIDCRSFELIKFRTMLTVEAGQGRETDDERITGLGAFLRNSSLDELPTLLNVVRGEMSLVGPRPLLPKYLPRYSAEQIQRHHVRPGVTGWAQVNGRNSLSWAEKLGMDVWYVRNRSLALDSAIMARTVVVALRRTGIHSLNHATMPEFHGPT